MTDAANTHLWMQIALSLAETAAARDEVPVGAVIVHEGKLIATGYNLRETHANPCAHAEIEAIEAACRTLGRWRLSDCDLYVTLEPCVMCAGAISQARLRHVYFGAMDPKAGAMGSLYKIHEDARLNHRLPVTSGLMAERCGAILTNFFRAKRQR